MKPKLVISGASESPGCALFLRTSGQVGSAGRVSGAIPEGCRLESCTCLLRSPPPIAILCINRLFSTPVVVLLMMLFETNILISENSSGPEILFHFTNSLASKAKAAVILQFVSLPVSSNQNPEIAKGVCTDIELSIPRNVWASWLSGKSFWRDTRRSQVRILHLPFAIPSIFRHRCIERPLTILKDAV